MDEVRFNPSKTKESTMNSAQPLQYLKDHQQKYFQWLKELVAIPSVSLPGFDYAEVARCSESVRRLMQEAGLQNVEIIAMADKQRPYVYGEWLNAPGQPTILLYSHYDVQPIGTPEKWLSPPFELTEREGRLFGRGSADDKGGLVAELAAIDAWLKTQGRLPVNVKVLIEGEEEDGSSCLDSFIAKYKDKIQADAIVIVDAENFDVETAGLTVSLRGMVAASVEIRTLKQPVHSGLWGGPLPDAALALTKTLATLVDAEGTIQVPGILEMVQPMSEADKQQLRSLPMDINKFRREAGLLPEAPIIGSETEVRERLWFRPKLGINAIQAGSRAQAGNIVVDTAWAKIGLRTVPDIDGQKAFELIKQHLEKSVPFGLQIEVKLLSTGNWWRTKTDHPIFAKMQNALARGWGKEAVKIGCGASIPFVQTFSEALGGAPALLLGVADPLTQAHSENESVSIKGWGHTVSSLIHFFGDL
jgi:acetylornithine deacetylase/succinyl-diaminopimelate desuccinylase-like protein